MIRRAVIHRLREAVPSLGGRVYQAFLAPACATRPYATVKLTPGGASSRVAFAGDHELEVRVYGDMADFLDLDQVTGEVLDALHGREITDPVEAEKYLLTWIPGTLDFADEERRLIGRLVRFKAAAIFGP